MAHRLTNLTPHLSLRYTLPHLAQTTCHQHLAPLHQPHHLPSWHQTQLLNIHSVRTSTCVADKPATNMSAPSPGPTTSKAPAYFNSTHHRPASTFEPPTPIVSLQYTPHSPLPPTQPPSPPKTWTCTGTTPVSTRAPSRNTPILTTHTPAPKRPRTIPKNSTDPPPIESQLSLLHLPADEREHTEHITESSLPPEFQARAGPSRQSLERFNPSSTNIDTSAINDESTNVVMQKEGALDNVWRLVNTISSLKTQRNYERIVTKRTVARIEDFEEKAEEFLKEFRNFVDDGKSRKQPRF